jgi:hypothetical protein
MLYGYVVLVVTAVLAVRHARAPYASRRSKRMVGGLAAASVLAPYLWPSFLPSGAWVPLASLSLQFGVCFYVLFHQAAWRPEAAHRKSCGTLHPIDPSERSIGEDS